MRNLCQIFCVKTGKTCAVVLIVCLFLGLTPAAESVSVKLRGKIALVGILSGFAYATHALVKRDRRVVEKLQLRLGPPDRVIQFERGFDLWRINYYGEQCYLFRNNRFVKIVPCISLQSNLSNRRWTFASPSSTLQAGFRYVFTLPSSRSTGNQSETFAKRSGAKRESQTFKKPFLIDTPVLGHPKWLQPYPLHPQQAPPLVSFDLYRLGDAGLLRSLSSYSSRRLYLSWWHLRARRYEAPSHQLP